MFTKKVYLKLRYYDGEFELFLEQPTVRPIVLPFGLACIFTSILIIIGSRIEITGFALFGTTIMYIIWSYLTIKYEKKEINNHDIRK
jgi:Ni,Fe-hydrogenase I cytochrome b subunit